MSGAAFDWRTYLHLAQVLLAQADRSPLQEAYQRSAVSRAYYAAFCHARNWAQTRLGFRPRGTAADHFGLKEHLAQSGASHFISAANLLDRLRKLRNQCDYEDKLPDLPVLAPSALQIAQQILAYFP
ncbi:MAG: hypothetical protein RMM31_08575 [Anaerolineae bacterium]|nr:hypothetical protein [Thermoflexales bacterium]MDW8396282.1 hypothetical protein [Anaerolineae bacterium]